MGAEGGGNVGGARGDLGGVRTLEGGGQAADLIETGIALAADHLGGGMNMYERA